MVLELEILENRLVIANLPKLQKAKDMVRNCFRRPGIAGVKNEKFAYLLHTYRYLIKFGFSSNNIYCS
jgi:hypothetical protein